MNIQDLAGENLQVLAHNPYPGRWIVMGRTPDGDPVQIYCTMGRGAGSRNRVLKPVPDKHGWLETKLADPSRSTNDPNLLYTAMAEQDGAFIVSNGAQTNAVVNGGILALKEGWQYESDEPTYTPRITGRIQMRGNTMDLRMIMLRKSPFGNGCDYLDYSYNEVAGGYGYFFSTYLENDDPPPSFRGEPLIVPIEGTDPDQIVKNFWSILNEDNRVSIAVKVITPGHPSETSIFNKYAEVI